MTTAHTPGPWKVFPRHNSMIDIQHSMGDVKGAITLTLCRVQARDTWLAEAEANARLIAAAPDLLAALQGMLQQASDSCDQGDYTVFGCNARAAIAKATGAPA